MIMLRWFNPKNLQEKKFDKYPKVYNNNRRTK